MMPSKTAQRMAILREKLGRCRCASCGVWMSSPPWLPYAQAPDNTRTKGHVLPKVMRTEKHLDCIWVWMCAKCNKEQGGLTLYEWYVRLGQAGDPRAPVVGSICEMLRDANVRYR